MQQKWLTKLLGYDYEIMFREGKENKVAHALSRVGMEQGSEITALSVVQTDWLQSLQQAWETDRELKLIIDQLTTDPNLHEGYSWSHGILSYKGTGKFRPQSQGPHPARAAFQPNGRSLRDP